MADLSVGFTDKDLLALHRQVSEKLGDAQMASFDRSLPTVDYTRHQPGPITASSDGILQSQELFVALATRPKLYGLYQKFYGENLPWVPSRNSLNKELLKNFDEMVGDWRKENPKKDKHGPELAKEILTWVLKPRPQGMGMKPEQLGPEWTFDRAVREKKGNCTELTFILLNLYERAGFKVHPEWVGVDMHGESVVHVCTGVEINGKTYLVDAVYGESGKGVVDDMGIFDAPHRSHTPVTLSQLLGFYWHNRALYEDQHGDKKLALDFYRRAETIDPYNLLIYINRGLFYLESGKFTKEEGVKRAEKEFRQALTMDPNFPPALRELGILFDGRNEFRNALVYLRKSLKGDARDLKTRVHLVQALGGLKRFSEAKKELKALQDEVPFNASLRERRPVDQVAAWLDSQMKKMKPSIKSAYNSNR